MTVLVRAEQQNPRNAALTVNRGSVAAPQLGSLATAKAQWRATVWENPDDPFARRALSDIAFQSGQFAEAAQLLRSFAATAPEYTNLGASLQALARHDEAEAAYRKAIALDPRCAVAHFNLANLLHRQQHDAAAEAEYRAALALHYDYAKAWNGLGQSLQRQGRLKPALDAFRHATH
jgi:tetratricopeptide (TPR) repeat protein